MEINMCIEHVSVHTPFDNLLRLAKEYPEFGFPSYLLKNKGNLYICKSEKGRDYYLGKKRNAHRFRVFQAEKLCKKHPDKFNVVTLDTVHERAFNVFWRLREKHTVHVVYMHNVTGQYYGLPTGKHITYIPLYRERKKGFVEVFWNGCQEIEFQLYGSKVNFV